MADGAHDHPQYAAAVAALAGKVDELAARVAKLEQTPTLPPPADPPPVGEPNVPAGGQLGLSLNPADYGPAKNLPARDAYTGPTTIKTVGTVIADKIIKAPLTIAADNVTVRNCSISGAGNYASVEYGTSKNFTIVDSVVDGSAGGDCGVYDLVHGWGPNVTVRRCELRYGANGVEFGGSGLVEGCYIHHIWQRPGTQDHADGIQVDAGGPYTIRNNFVDMGTPPAGRWAQTSAIGMWGDVGNLRDVLVTGNVVGPCGGFLFYCGVTAGSYAATNVRFDGNVILREPQGGEYGVWYSTSQYPQRGTHTGNVYADGTPAD